MRLRELDLAWGRGGAKDLKHGRHGPICALILRSWSLRTCVHAVPLFMLPSLPSSCSLSFYPWQRPILKPLRPALGSLPAKASQHPPPPAMTSLGCPGLWAGASLCQDWELTQGG